MTKEVVFRIIELPTHQVLLIKCVDEDEPTMKIMICHDETLVTQTLTFKEEEKRDAVFNEHTEETAQKNLNSVLRVVYNEEML